MLKMLAFTVFAAIVVTGSARAQEKCTVYHARCMQILKNNPNWNTVPNRESCDARLAAAYKWHYWVDKYSRSHPCN